MKKLSPIIIVTMIAFCFASCHKCNDPSNPDCKNYNPCYGQLPTSANFVIQENPDPSVGQYYLSKWIYYNTDTAVPRYVTFKAEITDAQSYEWHIGSGVYSTDSIQLNFMGVAPGTVIPITLIVRRIPNTKCFPNDPGIDTVTRNMTIGSYSEYTSALLGNYVGYYTDEPQKTVNFNFYMAQDSGQPQGVLTTYVSSNTFPDSTVSYGGTEYAMREFVFGPGINYSFDCLLYIDSTGGAIIYTETWQQVPPTQRTFIGKKN